MRGSVRRVLEGENPGTVAADDHGIWYREMFAPEMAAGLVQPFDLAGYRNAPVYIRRGLFAKYARLYAAINPHVIDLRIQTSETACMTGKGLIRSLRRRAKADGGTFKVNRKRGKGAMRWSPSASGDHLCHFMAGICRQELAARFCANSACGPKSWNPRSDRCIREALAPIEPR